MREGVLGGVGGRTERSVAVRWLGSLLYRHLNHLDLVLTLAASVTPSSPTGSDQLTDTWPSLPVFSAFGDIEASRLDCTKREVRGGE